MAHKTTEKTKAMVRNMSIAGVPQLNIAKTLGIGEVTLRKHYREELDRALDEAIAYAANKLMQKVKDGNLSAIIFFLKTRARGQFAEKMNIEGSIDLPDIKVQVTKKSDD